MKKKYRLPRLSYKDQVMCYYIFLEEVEKQKWGWYYNSPWGDDKEEIIYLQ